MCIFLKNSTEKSFIKSNVSGSKRPFSNMVSTLKRGIWKVSVFLKTAVLLRAQKLMMDSGYFYFSGQFVHVRCFTSISATPLLNYWQHTTKRRHYFYNLGSSIL